MFERLFDNLLHVATYARGRPRLTRWRVALVGALLLALTVPIEAQQQSVSGTVVDARTRQPISNVQVTVEGTDFADLTDNDGAYTIVGTFTGRITLIAVRIGFRPQTLAVASGTANNVIAISETLISLDEIVVTGTVGAQTARSVGNSISIIDTEELVKIAPPRDIQQMISAQVPGARFVSGGGEVGSGGNARIRGVSSLTISANPLVYVDGVRVNGADNEINSGVGVDSRWRPSRLNDFNPEDIESIEVIKGPAAATLYGTEASNGVIQIITKRGRAGRPTVNLNVRQGALWLPDAQNAFPTVFYERGGLFSGGEVVEVNVLEEDLKQGLGPWFRTGHLQSYGGSVTGGSDDVQYYIAADWDRDEGIVPYNWKNQLSGRANVTYSPNSTFNIDFSLGMVRSTLQSSSAQQPLSTAIIWACPAPGCEPGSGVPADLEGPSRGYIAYLPEAYENEIEGFQHLDRSTFSVQARHNPFSWLSHRLVVGGDFGTTKNTELYRATGNLGNTQNFGVKRDENIRNTYVSFDYGATGTYDKLLDFSFATSAGVQVYRRQQEIIFAQGQFFPVSALETITSGSQRTATEDFIENRTFGLYFQEQISWKDRIFLTGAVRGDDNSAFGKNFDFVVYPKLSATWVITDEPFFGDNSIVTDLKLRTAWGKAGQQPDAFAAIRTYEPAIGPDGVSSLTPDNIGNFDLKPEVGREVEVGFDASLINDNIGVEFTYFDQKRTDAIVRVPVLPSTGFPGSQFQNIGSVTNSGIELGLSANVLEQENVVLDLGFNYSTTKNEISDLGGQPPIVHAASQGQWHVQGFPIGSIFLKRVVSADIVNTPGYPVADPASVMCEGGDVIPGSPNLSRGGGPAVPCSAAPAVYSGQPIPTWEGSGSATLTLFQNLQLHGLVDYVGGMTKIFGDNAAVHRFFLNSRAILERTDPILLGYEALGGEGLWQPGLWDGGFAKLRTVSGTYEFPREWAEKFGGSRLSLTVAVENLATLWRAQSTDAFGHGIVEVERNQGTGTTNGLTAYQQEGWPQNRRFISTVRVTF